MSSAAPLQPGPAVALDAEKPPSQLRFRIAFFLVAVIVVGLAVTLPFAARSLFDDLLSSVDGRVYPLVGHRGPGAGPERSHMHISISDLDESRLRLTLRVSAHRVCPNGCPNGTRIVLFSVGSEDDESAGMPPSASIDLVDGQSVVTQIVELPIHGHPTLYPFDTYALGLGIGLADLTTDRKDVPLTRQQAEGLLVATIQEHLPRENMEPPVPATRDTLRHADAPFELQSLTVLRFARPLHEQVLAVVLVVLIAAAAAYAVFMRPLHDLVINCGGLVLGVWGVRSLLSPGTASRTLVDISLSMVVMFLLAAITFRALQFLYVRGGFGKHAPATVPAAEQPESAWHRHGSRP